jgi:hypothetical protein
MRLGRGGDICRDEVSDAASIDFSRRDVSRLLKVHEPVCRVRLYFIVDGAHGLHGAEYAMLGHSSTALTT